MLGVSPLIVFPYIRLHLSRAERDSLAGHEEEVSCDDVRGPQGKECRQPLGAQSRQKTRTQSYNHKNSAKSLSDPRIRSFLLATDETADTWITTWGGPEQGTQLSASVLLIHRN